MRLSDIVHAGARTALAIGTLVALVSCADVVETADDGPRRPNSIDENGGRVSRLFFAVVGDTRPAVVNDLSGYPVDIIDTIYADIEALDPKPLFAVSTGDYIFTKPYGPHADEQLDLYLTARHRFSGTLFPAMGNHECSGFTESNCNAHGPKKAPHNFTAYMSKMLEPLHKPEPYYSIQIDANDGSWNAKLVFVAPNAWTWEQGQWLDAELSVKTTYTFIVRHEPRDAKTAPGVVPSERIISQHPYTLLIAGHTHTYERSGPREVIIGNGGAPPTGAKNFGFGLIQQRPDGAIQVDVMDWKTSEPDLGFRFAVNADGSPAAPL